jgi:PST family polysaccharide transporter
MKETPLKQAGSALVWRAVQLGGVKVIFMVRLLVLAWLLTPEDFGLMAIAVTAIGFFLNVTDIGMIPALVQGAEVDEKRYNAAWTVNVSRALLITLIVILTAPLIAQIFAEPRAVNIIRVLAMRPVLEALASIKVASLTRKLQFYPLAMIKLGEGLANIIVSIVLAPALGVWALVIGTLVGSMFYLLLSYLFAPHRPQLLFDSSSIQPLIKFGRWVFATSLIIMAGNYVLKVVISRQLGVAELGLYTLAIQLAFLPAEIASEIIGSVAFPLFARLQADIRQVTQIFRTTLIGMAALLFPVCLLIISLAPILEDLLGPRWAGTGPIIRILAFASIIGLLGEVVVPTLTGLGQPYKVTVIEVVQSLLFIGAVWTLTPLYGLSGAALAWLPAMIISQCVGIVFVQRLLWRPFAGLSKPVLAITLASVVGALVALIIAGLWPNLAGFFIANLLAVLVIAVFLWESDRRFTLGLVNNLGRIFPQVAGFIGYRPADG